MSHFAKKGNDETLDKGILNLTSQFHKNKKLGQFCSSMYLSFNDAAGSSHERTISEC